jgi:hypothetical protein
MVAWRRIAKLSIDHFRTLFGGVGTLIGAQIGHDSRTMEGGLLVIGIRLVIHAFEI